jgi:lipoate-protein ligase A
MFSIFSPLSRAANVDSYVKERIFLDILPFSYATGAEHMKLDEQLAQEHRDQSSAQLRFYGWQPYCLSLGYHQDASLVNTVELQRSGYHWIRRPTGGRAIFHAEELTYCAIFPGKKISPQKLYKLIHESIARALQLLGYPVQLAPDSLIIPKLAKGKRIDTPCFTRSAPTEIRYQGKKLVGSAQRIYPMAILQHGSILIGNAHKLLPDFLVIKAEERDRIKQDMEQRTICLKEIKPLSGIENKLQTAIAKQLEIIGNCLLNYKKV